MFKFFEVYAQNKIFETTEKVFERRNRVFDDIEKEIFNIGRRYNMSNSGFISSTADSNAIRRDLKNKGLQVYIDAARLFSLSHNLRGINNTYLRFKQLAISDPKNAENQ